MSRIGYFPKSGFKRNPIKDCVGRNDSCVCLSGKKFKKCCMLKIPPIVTELEAQVITQELIDIGYEPKKYQVV